ncbi:PqiC family protein [Magnetospirillum molischianum]|uniref:ABC-type transport auxiliary lipoprotein component domain-containing protein n=1 Tax=Magnetospirillum molischianum DSM 120 TaxID=1150626 RepID=H8FX79_MAGML|nr:PqiC family protein [Magnetospirillum molischianum]CCG42967.1 conserved exported hypothetical protein [Magnetospirillum molischianum DSM 120]
MPTFVAALVLLMLLGGCVARPEQHIYVLGGSDPASDDRLDSRRMVIELKPVLIPDHMDTTDFLLRTGINELSRSTTAIWGERLSIGITRTLASALATRLPSVRFAVSPSATRPARRIFVDIAVLEIRRGGACTVGAHWTVSALGAESGPQSAFAPVGAEATVTTVAEGASDESVVVALTHAIDQIADRIAATLSDHIANSGTKMKTGGLG